MTKYGNLQPTENITFNGYFHEMRYHIYKKKDFLFTKTFSKIPGCDLLINTKYYYNQDISYNKLTDSFFECAQLCKNQIDICKYGWSYEAASQKVGNNQKIFLFSFLQFTLLVLLWNWI